MIKKLLLNTAAVIALLAGYPTAQTATANGNRQELVDSAGKDAVVVYSDTTANDTVRVTVSQHNGGFFGHNSTTVDIDADDFPSAMKGLLHSLDSSEMLGVFFVLAVLLILFVVAPVLILIVLFYFINRNRKQRLQMAQIAAQNGQPIPEELLTDKAVDVDDEYQKGMRQCFVGVGLMVFLGYAVGNIGFGIGALVFCIGLGKVFASRTARRHVERDDHPVGNRRDSSDEVPDTL